VPQDLSVVGYGNSSVSHLLTPAVTTVHEHKKNIGVQAGRLMMRLLQGESLAGSLVQKLSPHLVIGESVARQ
jgi:DNA-binding LacI/PurR family transcriptional regulator